MRIFSVIIYSLKKDRLYRFFISLAARHQLLTSYTEPTEVTTLITALILQWVKKTTHKVTTSARLRTGGVPQSQHSQYTDNISLQTQHNTQNTIIISTEIHPSSTKHLLQLSTHQESLISVLNCASFISLAQQLISATQPVTPLSFKKEEKRYPHLSDTE